MKVIMKNLVIPLFICSLILGPGFRANAADPSELKPFLKKSLMYKCRTINKEVPMNIYYNGKTTYDEATGTDEAEVIVYVKNKAWDRIGQESDLSILSDYLKKKFIVITVDFGNDKEASSPRFDEDLEWIFRGVYGYSPEKGYDAESLVKDVHLTPMEYRCFFLPEGDRVATNLTYWEIDKHGSYGTLEYIMNSYNNDIVTKYPGRKPVASPKELVDKKGNPFDYRIKMDIIYPSQPKKKIPCVFNSETVPARNPEAQPNGYYPHLAGFCMRGYVGVNMGHCFNPCVPHFFHFISFELDNWDGYKCYSAGVRYLNANAGKYGIDARYIGGMGISKGQYAITRLSDPHNSGVQEQSTYKGFPEGSPEPQPWQGYPSKIQCGWQAAGGGLWATQFITADYVPTILSVGTKDRDVITKEGHPKFLKRLEELDVNYIEQWMKDLGHEFPHGYDDVMGVDRYKLFMDFFDHYLKIEDKLPPCVLLVYPHDKKEDVAANDQIYIHFAPVIDEKTVLENKAIRVVSLKDNKDVAGSWKASAHGTKFTFSASQPLNKNEQYKIVVTTRIKDKRGTAMDKESTYQFKVS
jgi:hypothetical protein